MKCEICGSSECDCEEVCRDALEKLISMLGKDFNVPNRKVRDLLKRII